MVYAFQETQEATVAAQEATNSLVTENFLDIFFVGWRIVVSYSVDCATSGSGIHFLQEICEFEAKRIGTS